MSSNSTREPIIPLKIVAWASTSFALLVIYFLIVCMFDEELFERQVSTVHILFVAPIVFGCFWMFTTWILKRQFIASPVLRDITLAGYVLFFGLIFLDVSYSVFINLSQRQIADDRLTDPNTWAVEFYPKLYYPTQKNFRFHKPLRTIHGSHYGDMYSPSLLASPTLSSSVFSKKELTVSINANGFRDTGNPQESKIFAIGDSFTFGWGIEQNRTWVELLEHSLGQPVYNLGIHDASPLQEYLLLDHLIESRNLDLSGGILLWMIFEGNDLEDSYVSQAPRNSRSLLGQLFKGTLLESIVSFLPSIKRQSVLAKFQEGVATFSGLPGGNSEKYAHVIDGLEAPFPLYVSANFGRKLFHPDQIKRAQNPKDYVESHPNRPVLEKTFQNMSSLAERIGFDVVVIIAPSDARLYGKYFDNFPMLSVDSYFNLLVLELSRQFGFMVVNLEQMMQPYAKAELLYFRDDDHWNERGHVVAAKLIGRSLLKQRFLAATPDL